MGNDFPKISRVRSAISARDWSFIREVCCLTGNGGDSIARDRFEFFARVWVEPYEWFARDAAYIVESETGESVGYLTGAWDTELLEKKKQWLHAPRLAVGLVAKAITGRWNSDEKRFWRRFWRLDQGPEAAFGAERVRELRARFPAHLHMNCLESARGRGAGKRLFEAFASDLRRRQIPGLHLFCGEGPLAFYFAQGMREIARIEFRPGVWVYALGYEVRAESENEVYAPPPPR